LWEHIVVFPFFVSTSISHQCAPCVVLKYWYGFFYWCVLLKICYEFDFVREARAMERIREFLRVTNKKPPVTVPRLIPGMVSRYNIIAAHLAKVFFRLFNWIVVLYHMFSWMQWLSLVWWFQQSNYKSATYRLTDTGTRNIY